MGHVIPRTLYILLSVQAHLKGVEELLICAILDGESIGRHVIADHLSECLVQRGYANAIDAHEKCHRRWKTGRSGLSGRGPLWLSRYHILRRHIGTILRLRLL